MLGAAGGANVGSVLANAMCETPADTSSTFENQNSSGSTDNPEGGERCEANLSRDLETCSTIAKREGKQYYKVCES